MPVRLTLKHVTPSILTDTFAKNPVDIIANLVIISNMKEHENGEKKAPRSNINEAHIYLAHTYILKKISLASPNS